jgi:uncharacterized protein (TIGR03435 family)
LRLLACLLLAASLTPPAFAQATPAISPDARFEVATIKPGDPHESHGIRFLVSFTRVDTANTSVFDLLKYAYGLHADQIIGGDDTLMHRGYAINAVVSADTPIKPNADLLKQMLRNLLADRFGLIVHTDSRELPVYALTVADPNVHLKATVQTMPMTTGGYSPGYLSVNHASPRDLAAYLQRFVTNRPVVDHTGVSGQYDIDLHFTPDDAPEPTKDNKTGQDYPNLYTAIREQLGLKLTATKAPVDVIVIDKVTEPTAN